jgi:hypothetical protein
MAELTKEQQVRALREARYKRRMKPAATIEKLLKMPDRQFAQQLALVCPKCLLLEQEVSELERQSRHYETVLRQNEAEIKMLKRELAKRKKASHG